MLYISLYSHKHIEESFFIHYYTKKNHILSKYDSKKRKYTPINIYHSPVYNDIYQKKYVYE